MRFNWKWRHGPISGPAHAALALTAAQTVGTLPVVDARPEYVLGAGAAAMGVTVWRSRFSGRSRLGVTYRLAGLGGSSAWLAHAVTEGGWTPTLAWTLAAGAVTAGAFWRPVAMWDRRAQAVHQAQEEERLAVALDAATQDRLHSVAGQWVARLEQVCGVRGARVLAVEDWVFPGPDGQPRKTGFTLEVLLPTTGATWNTIAAYTDGLASAADLPEGCPVEVGPGASKRRCLIEVSTYDALRDDIALPAVTAPRTINDPVPAGTVRNGSQAAVPLRFGSAVLVGATGSGKSNELQTLMAGLVACADVLVCVIDYNGGGVALPWLAPWAAGETTKSPLLWVADNEEEALLLCTWLIGVIEHRKRAYHAANAARNDDKLAASPATPQIVLVTDEAGALGRTELKLIAQISDRGRAAAVRTVTCALRALAEYIPTEVLAQAQVRIGMRVNDRKELGYLYDWAGGRGGPSPEDAPHTGYGHFRTGVEPPRVFKGYRTTPEAIREVAVASDAWRPELDRVTAEMPGFGSVFADRWERSAHLLEAAAGRPVGAAAGSGPGRPRPEAPRRSAPDGGSATERLAGALDDLHAAAERMRNAEPSGPTQPRDDAAEFERIVAGEVIVPELLVRILDAFGAQERMHTRVLAERIGAHTATLGALLSQVDVRPLKSDFTVDGKRARGYARADVERAADRIRMGERPVPDEVARWRPPGG